METNISVLESVLGELESIKFLLSMIMLGMGCVVGSLLGRYTGRR